MSGQIDLVRHRSNAARAVKDSLTADDKELPALGSVEGTSILAPRQLWEKLAGRTR
jgi:hypothetical protein